MTTGSSILSPARENKEKFLDTAFQSSRYKSSSGQGEI